MANCKHCMHVMNVRNLNLNEEALRSYPLPEYEFLCNHPDLIL